jgi:hypothetical protein
MPRLGRAAERQIDRNLSELIPVDRPGITFNDLVEKAKPISRPTVSQRLKKFKRTGLVIHDGDFYRRNPLGSSFQTNLQITTRLHDSEADWSGWQSSFPQKIDASKTRLARTTRSCWEEKKLNHVRPIAYEPLAHGDLLHPLMHAILSAVSGYLDLLQAVAQAPDQSTAHEITDVWLNISVTRHLDLLARLVWEFRKELSFRELNGRRLSLEFVTHEYTGWDFTVWPPVPPSQHGDSRMSLSKREHLREN